MKFRKYMDNFWFGNSSEDEVNGITFVFKSKEDRIKFMKFDVIMVPQFRK